MNVIGCVTDGRGMCGFLYVVSNKIMFKSQIYIYKYLDTGLPFVIIAENDPVKLTSSALTHASTWCMLGRAGQFDGVAANAIMRPLWSILIIH